MAHLERDLDQPRPGSDPSRARKRKLKRQNGEESTIHAESPMNKRRADRSRLSNRGGPSSRESLVADQIKAKSQSFPSVQGKLSSKLGFGARPSKASSASRNARRETRVSFIETPYEATSRSESQRIVNPDPGYEPRKGRRVFDAHSDAAPPVMVRGGLGGMAFGRTASSRLQKQRTPKRRYDVPLRSTGAELRLPSIPFIHLGWRAVSGFMVLLMSACMVLMWKAPVFQVKTVEAVGLKRLTVTDLNAVMGTFGKSIFTLNPHLLHDTLSLAFPELSKISVRVNLPASVKVVVTEREPVISWTQDGAESWVDKYGISFPMRGTPATALVKVEGHGNPPGIAQVDELSASTGLPNTQAAGEPRLKLTPELVSAILALGGKMPAETVLVYDSQHGLGWNDPNGWEVFFGNEDQDMDMKLIVYQALVDRLQSEGIQPAMISVEYVHAPYYRMER